MDTSSLIVVIAMAVIAVGGIAFLIYRAKQNR